MGGISGFLGNPDLREPAEELARRMLSRIRHRVGAETGILAEPGVLLAASTASGTRGVQSGDVVVVLDGAIYNAASLRKDLGAKGYVFATGSDTEVIARAYEDMGADCLSVFNGDFAFALWDRRSNRLMLARDRMGARPLFYAWRKGTLYFASEIKALFEVPGLRADIDPVAIDQTFTFGFPLAPRTPFLNVLELPAAHAMVASPREVVVRRYWQLDCPDAADLAPSSEPCDASTFAGELRALLADATRIRLRSGTSAGTRLAGLAEPSVTGAATPGDVADAFPETVFHTERPVLSMAPATLYATARAARDRAVRVLLSDRGADEVFGRWFRSCPTSVSDRAIDDPLDRHLPRFRANARAKLLYSSEMREMLAGYSALDDLRAQLPADFQRWHPATQTQYLETTYMLPGEALAWGDRATMAHKVAVRSPFLDHRIVDFAVRIPPEMRMQGLDQKRMLREATSDFVSPEVFAPDETAGPNGGGGIPDVAALPWVAERLSVPEMAVAGFFAPAGVQKLHARYRAGEAGSARDAMAFVGILSTQLLHRAFVADASMQTLVAA